MFALLCDNDHVYFSRFSANDREELDDLTIHRFRSKADDAVDALGPFLGMQKDCKVADVLQLQISGSHLCLWDK